MRDPSLHIKRSDLVKVLGKIFKSNAGIDIQGLSNTLIELGKPYAASSRVFVITNERQEKRMAHIVSASRQDANMMANYLFLVRRKLKHRGIQLIKPSSKDWDLIKELANNANNFCNEFDVTKSVGYVKFLEIGLKKMSKFSLGKMLGMYSSICESYGALKEIEEDPTPNQTTQLMDYYRYKVANITGIVTSYKDLPEKQVFFVKAKEITNQLGVSYKTYIDAQFAMMEFRGALPDPLQLVGPKAKERLNKYMYQNKIVK